MPFTIEVVPEQCLVHLIASGAFDFETARSAMQQVSESLERHLELGLGILIDVRATDYTPSTTEIRHFANRHSEMTQTWKNPAAVVAPAGVRFGMARMMCALIELAGGKCSAFTEPDEARAWLAVEVEKLRHAP